MRAAGYPGGLLRHGAAAGGGHGADTLPAGLPDGAGGGDPPGAAPHGGALGGDGPASGPGGGSGGAGASAAGPLRKLRGKEADVCSNRVFAARLPGRRCSRWWAYAWPTSASMSAWGLPRRCGKRSPRRCWPR